MFTTQLKAKSLGEIVKKGQNLGGRFVPVVHLANDQAIKSVACSFAKDSKNGICLRLVCPDLDDNIDDREDDRDDIEDELADDLANPNSKLSKYYELTNALREERNEIK